MRNRLIRKVPSGLLVAVFLASLIVAGPLATNYRGAIRASAATALPGPYQPVVPTRILDTRNGVGGYAKPIGTNQSISVQIAGLAGVPGVSAAVAPTAVVLNVTATNPTAASYLTVFPSGVTRPLASNLNFVAGQTVANLVEVALGSDGAVMLYNAWGSTDAVFDLAGWVATPSPTLGTAGLYTPLVPARILDTRNGGGAKLGAGQTLNLQVTGAGGVPTIGVGAAVLNVTATNPTAASYLTVFPTAAPRPLASNLNFLAGQTVPNRVIVKAGVNGQVSIFNSSGLTDVVVDVNGWFTDGSSTSATGGQFSGTTPTRILDTRYGTGGFSTPVGPGQSISVLVAGKAGVPASGATAAVLNVTVTNATAASYLTAYPSMTPLPLASDLNWTAGRTVPNLVVVKLGSDGKVSFFNSAGTTAVVADVVGWYWPSTLPPPTPSPTPTPCPSPAPGTVGNPGPCYYAKWTNGPSSDPTYFPIGVWLQDPNRTENGINNAINFKNIGVNVFVGLWNWPPDPALSTLAAAGVPVIAGGFAGNTSEVAYILANPNASVVKAYQLYDEPDMPNTAAGCLPPSTLQSMADADRAADPTRPIHINFGWGVAIPNFGSGPNCIPTDQQGALYLQACDICSADYYPISDPWRCSGDCLWEYGRTVDRVRSLSNYQKPVWNFVETEDCCNTTGPARATPAQVKSAVWLSIIHGAIGIEYFCHQFYDPTTGASAFIEDACLVDTTMAANLKAIDAQIAQLAPVLNSAWINNGVQVTSTNSAVPIDTMVKSYGGATYVFAISGRAGTTSGTFSVAGVANATAQVVGEGRAIPVVNGQFSDDFNADYQVHIYQIS